MKKRPTTREEATKEAVEIAKEQITKYPQLKGNMIIPIVWYPEDKKD